MSELSIGIVVPVYNEAGLLAAALADLRVKAPGLPVVVVDGASSDGSAEIAREFFPVVHTSQPNRGAQLNRGAARLTADVLLFLHADSRLPADFACRIRDAMADPAVAGGCFRLRFDEPRPLLRFYGWCTRFHSRFFHFGDQGFFVRREIFERMDGYRELPFLEDVEFLRRLRRQGRFRVLRPAVITSARRFRRRGVLRQQLRNAILVALFELGVPAERLAAFYPHLR
jgi:rSAM/selenodomain-associated transferase 2